MTLPQPEDLQPAWLETPEALDQWLLAQHGDDPVAIDSEFERTSTFFARPGLVQIANREGAWLVEPDVAEASTVLREFLADPNQLKLMYALSEDIELFREWLGVETRGVLDVQIAAALSGEGMSVGFANLVERLLGISLDKGLTRSDWLARPLTIPQQQYALADVVYLLPLYQQLHERLAENGQLPALVEESDRFCEDLAGLGDPDTYYLRLRSGWFLDPERQSLLQALCRWREQRCRELDRPRGRVVGDKLLLAIAERQPTTRDALARIPDMPPVVVRKHGEPLLDIVQQESAEGGAPATAIEPPLTRKEQATYKAIKSVLQQALDNSPVPIELLAPRKKLEGQVRAGIANGEIPELLSTGWRGELLVPVHSDLEAILQNG